jgi:ribosomal protein L16 Arg81 hydroxylase
MYLINKTKYSEHYSLISILTTHAIYLTHIIKISVASIKYTIIKRLICCFYYTFFGDFITNPNKENSNLEVNSTYIVNECIDDPMTDDSVHTKRALSSIPIEKDVELIELKKTTKSLVALKAAMQLIKKGQAKYCKNSVESGVTLLDIDLNWGNKNSRLSLTTYLPKGGSYGPHYDTSNGVADGRIVLRIKPKTGSRYLQQGDWMFKVYGESVSETEDYTFRSEKHF